MDLFEIPKQEVQHPPAQANEFSDFNIKWIPPFEEGIKTKTGKNIDKVVDITKKAAGFYMYGLGLVALLIILPAIVRFLYEFSRWAYEAAGNVFP